MDATSLSSGWSSLRIHPS